MFLSMHTGGLRLGGGGSQPGGIGGGLQLGGGGLQLGQMGRGGLQLQTNSSVPGGLQLGQTQPTTGGGLQLGWGGESYLGN